MLRAPAALFLALVGSVVVGCSQGAAASDTPTAEAAGTSAGGGGVSTSTEQTEPGSGGAGGSAGGKDAIDPTPSAPSCARVHGGKTCGPDGKSDCCEIATQGDAKIAKYMITAGRMRTFIEKFDGDIAGFVKTLPAGKWKSEWNDADALPTDRTSADIALGPSGKKACEQGAFTGHTYWTPKTDEDFSDFDQDVLDEKALNCVPWQLMQALCAWDGGHLATAGELKAAFTNEGSTRFPWGDDDLQTKTAPDPLERLNIEGAFATSPLPKTFRKRDDGQPAEVSFMIAPPGRFPKGNNKAGIADSAGNLLEWAGDQPRQFIWKADFEHHGNDAAKLSGGYIWMDRLALGPFVWGKSQLFGAAGTPDQKLGYYAIGGRCAF